MWSNIIYERDKNRIKYLINLKAGYERYKKEPEQKKLV